MNALHRMEKSDASGWWEKRRKLYNVALVFAGLAAFACYAAVLDHFSCSGPQCRWSPEEVASHFVGNFDGRSFRLILDYPYNIPLRHQAAFLS